jgi:hypothetical protein
LLICVSANSAAAMAKSAMIGMRIIVSLPVVVFLLASHTIIFAETTETIRLCRAPSRPITPSLSSLVLQHNDVAGSPAGKQRPDQLRGHRLVALWTLILLQAISERVCVCDREGARRSG